MAPRRDHVSMHFLKKWVGYSYPSWAMTHLKKGFTSCCVRWFDEIWWSCSIKLIGHDWQVVFIINMLRANPAVTDSPWLKTRVEKTVVPYMFVCYLCVAKAFASDKSGQLLWILPPQEIDDRPSCQNLPQKDVMNRSGGSPCWSPVLGRLEVFLCIRRVGGLGNSRPKTGAENSKLRCFFLKS